ncbi:hypothetical protein ACOSP7_032355 [Xanthoceras sorbifolium]
MASSSRKTGGLQFKLSDSCILKIYEGDISQWFINGSSDAIVNPASENLLKSGPDEDGAIHRAAGPELRNACREFPRLKHKCRCPVGEAKITPGFGLPASYVIHAVGPERRSDADAEALLRRAYMISMSLAKENNIQYVAFPGLCTIKEHFVRFPFEEAATIALSTVKEFSNDFKEIHFVLAPIHNGPYATWLKKAKEMFPLKA